MVNDNDLIRMILGAARITERRKCFLSYYKGDKTLVDEFARTFNNVLIPKAIGISDSDDYINSDDPTYVMSRIRKDILGDASVTLVLIGDCTHSRRYVDWEIKASLQQGDSEPNGLIGILLPYKQNGAILPERFNANWNKNESNCYATYHFYPTSDTQLRGWIDDAYARRTSNAKLITNSQEMMKRNGKCLVHDIVH
jgi:hypothetical protein